jgi:hypothetical protein
MNIIANLQLLEVISGHRLVQAVASVSASGSDDVEMPRWCNYVLVIVPMAVAAAVSASSSTLSWCWSLRRQSSSSWWEPINQHCFCRLRQSNKELNPVPTVVSSSNSLLTIDKLTANFLTVRALPDPTVQG